MPIYCISLDDEIVSLVEGADTYCLEGPLTTFFRTRNGSPVVDSWSERLASFRTSSIASVQLLSGHEGPDERQCTQADRQRAAH